MNRRKFMLAAASVLAAFFATSSRYRPAPGDAVRVISYPDMGVVRRSKEAKAAVVGPIPNPERMNQNYRPGEQLYEVRLGPYSLQCYADELELA